MKKEKRMVAQILGLDLALHTGWARIVDGRVYESGVLDLSRVRDGMGRHNGHAFAALYAWLGDQTRPETLLAYELAHHRGGPATRLACGWQAVVQMFAARRGMAAPMAVATMTLKKWATGSGRSGKDQVKAWAAVRLGRPPIDDNEADAVAVGLWAAEQFDTKAVVIANGRA
jgi:Holliday junction resolvasome RuvABC endonuclease subunit